MPFPAHINALYNDLVENIRFAKLQQWRVVNYALLLYAAIYFVRDHAPLQNCAGKTSLTVATFITWTFGILVLGLLERSIGLFRDPVDYVYQRYFTVAERRNLTLESHPHWFERSIIFVGLIAVSTAGAALVLILVWGGKSLA
jgi:hypothetical protein